MSKQYIVNPNIKGISQIREGYISSSNAKSPFSDYSLINEYNQLMREKALDASSRFDLQGFNSNFVLTAYSLAYQKVTERTKTVINAVDACRNFYLVDVVLSQITEDALAPRSGSEEIFKFSSKDEEIQKELNFLKERLKLDELIENIAPDMCAYGEYILETDIKPNQGIVGIYDNQDQGTVIPLTQNGEIEKYLVLDELTGSVTQRHISSFITFSIGGQRMKVNFDKTAEMIARRNPNLSTYMKKIPKFLRIGKSMIYPFIQKFKELEVLEKLVPASKLNKLTQGNLIALPMPENYSLEQGLEAARRVEGMINKKVMVDPALQEITVEAILSTAGRNRVIPTFGDRGKLEKMDYKADEPDDLFSNAGELRTVILDSIGVPSELIYKSESANKAEILKRYAKYLRKLKKVQKAIAEGLKQLAIIHLVNKGRTFEEKDIEVVFSNTLVEIDNLDRLEHADITLTMLTNAKNFFAELAEEGSPFRKQVVMEKVAEYLEGNLKTIGLSDALYTSAEGGTSADDTHDNNVENGVEFSPDSEDEYVPEDDLSEPTEEQKELYPHIKYKFESKGSKIYEKRKKFIRKA